MRCMQIEFVMSLGIRTVCRMAYTSTSYLQYSLKINEKKLSVFIVLLYQLRRDYSNENHRIDGEIFD